VEHRLKTSQPYFDAVRDDLKTFEVRLHDRPFAVGDVLQLEEFTGPNGDLQLTGAVVRRVISYIVPGGSFGIARGYCVLGMVAVDSETGRALADARDAIEGLPDGTPEPYVAPASKVRAFAQRRGEGLQPKERVRANKRNNYFGSKR
jgi:hypothetical protein